MKEKAQIILGQVTILFMQYGIKSLTMDDIARHLGMSKKTLYQSFSDKAELVIKGIQSYMDEENKALCSIQEKSENAIEEMFLISQHVSQHLQSMHPSILFDLEKYYPAAFKKFNEYKTQIILACIARNIKEGIEQGLYRENINIPIVAGLYVGRMDIIFDQQLFPAIKYSPKDVYFEAIRYHIRGIASEKGMVYLKDKFNTLDTQHPIF
ncbi:TetR/AcrR family transcriptional regulator [Flavobacteriales bacterium]|nr:TetR/AcrR family transcriptional regulator [Flavobacteriales bacterium]